MSYVTVVNKPNRIATVHKSNCPYLGQFGENTASSERIPFDDGLPALAKAQSAMPDRFGFCRHCLKEFSTVIRMAA